jgi:predicted transposase/invertase (TIGR01784 family)
LTYNPTVLNKRERAEKEKAAQDGLKQGIEQGKRKKAFEMAHNLLELGIEMDRIVSASGLSRADMFVSQIISQAIT